MIKSRVKEIVDRCFAEGVRLGYWSAAAEGRYALEVPKREGQGDFSTNFALVAAGIDACKPRDLADRFAHLLRSDPVIERVEIAGPGFINLFLDVSIWTTVLAPIYQQGESFGTSSIGRGRRSWLSLSAPIPPGR
jgi:arginyl-tRNA synthetase